MSSAKDGCSGRDFCVEVHNRHGQSTDHGPHQIDCLPAATSGSDQALRKRRGGDGKPVAPTEGIRKRVVNKSER